MEAAQTSVDEKLKEYNAILQKREKEKEEIIEKARKIVYEREESSRRITSGLVLSAVIPSPKSSTCYVLSKLVAMTIILISQLLFIFTDFG